MNSVTGREPAMDGWQAKSPSSRRRTLVLLLLSGISWQLGCCAMTLRTERSRDGHRFQQRRFQQHENLSKPE